MPESPRAFISHASEDKSRFVIEFATKLRAAGVDAWVDAWEIRAGDSLVRRIFSQGIDEADVFIVVLSETSVTKPWVLEELDAAVIRRIQGGTRLIPVLIDDVDVPAALRHLRWVSVPVLGIDGSVTDIAGTLFASDLAPPLGSPPAYSRGTPKLVSNAVDDTVLGAAIDLVLENGAGGYGAEDLLARLPDLDLTPALIEESISSLAEQRIVEVERSFGGTSITRLRPRAWLAAMKARGLNVDELHDQLLTHFVNRSTSAGFDAADDETIDALVNILELEGLIGRPSRTLDGAAHAQATVAGQRRAREL
ncbi:toll/interleukin-1 receptor domain-containing protein [Microbacterium sp. F2E]|uniref:toll/interleukin-1 receptor domain-containing protein n=1 Tax=Microbacterium sp. F2E TaxID=2895284 RepID=UPI001E4633FC|nr:toll/interleukin-1 receptor domain-containing protein [Microbacterium sp. F2E]MCC9054413.1 toll/interleukin-1 receptor domain-containing protein [Microbacterium sp. F2E]